LYLIKLYSFVSSSLQNAIIVYFYISMIVSSLQGRINLLYLIVPYMFLKFFQRKIVSSNKV